MMLTMADFHPLLTFATGVSQDGGFRIFEKG